VVFFVTILIPEDPALGPFQLEVGMETFTEGTVKEIILDIPRGLLRNSRSPTAVLVVSGIGIGLISVSFLLDAPELSPPTKDVGAMEVPMVMTSE
jgi:hypothetical protein